MTSASRRLGAAMALSCATLLLVVSLGTAHALRGANESDAFNVRCDRSTMSQSDLDDGRVSITHLKGVSVAKNYDAMARAIFDANREVYLKHFAHSPFARWTCAAKSSFRRSPSSLRRTPCNGRKSLPCSAILIGPPTTSTRPAWSR